VFSSTPLVTDVVLGEVSVSPSPEDVSVIVVCDVTPEEVDISSSSEVSDVVSSGYSPILDEVTEGFGVDIDGNVGALVELVEESSVGTSDDAAVVVDVVKISAVDTSDEVAKNSAVDVSDNATVLSELGCKELENENSRLRKEVAEVSVCVEEMVADIGGRSSTVAPLPQVRNITVCYVNFYLL